MIPPLYIHIVETHELIHDNVRPWPPVVDVAYDMKVVNGQVLNQMAQGNDELDVYKRQVFVRLFFLGVALMKIGSPFPHQPGAPGSA